jgi:hypothetical protein
MAHPLGNRPFLGPAKMVDEAVKNSETAFGLSNK